METWEWALSDVSSKADGLMPYPSALETSANISGGGERPFWGHIRRATVEAAGRVL